MREKKAGMDEKVSAEQQLTKEQDNPQIFCERVHHKVSSKRAFLPDPEIKTTASRLTEITITIKLLVGVL